MLMLTTLTCGSILALSREVSSLFSRNAGAAFQGAMDKGEHTGAQQLVLVRQARALRQLACGVESRNAMGQGPDLDGDEADIDALEALRERVGQSLDQEIEGVADGLAAALDAFGPERGAGLALGGPGGEHGRVEARFLLGKGKISLAHAGEALKRRALALQRPPKPSRQLVVPAEGDLGHERVPAPEMAIERRGRHAHELGRVSQREPADPPFGNEALRRLDQRLLQIAVVAALPVERAAPMPHDEFLLSACRS